MNHQQRPSYGVPISGWTAVVGPKPYARNVRKAPNFIIADERDFTVEQQRLLDYLDRTHELGAAHFDGEED